MIDSFLVAVIGHPLDPVDMNPYFETSKVSTGTPNMDVDFTKDLLAYHHVHR